MPVHKVVLVNCTHRVYMKRYINLIVEEFCAERSLWDWNSNSHIWKPALFVFWYKLFYCFHLVREKLPPRPPGQRSEPESQRVSTGTCVNIPVLTGDSRTTVKHSTFHYRHCRCLGSSFSELSQEQAVTFMPPHCELQTVWNLEMIFPTWSMSYNTLALLITFQAISFYAVYVYIYKVIITFFCSFYSSSW